MSSHALGYRAGTSVSLLGRILRRSVCGLLGLVSGVCAAQQSPQVKAQPYVQSTGGRVTSFLPGQFQNPSGGVDILYINAPTSSGINSSIIAGIMLDGNGFTIPDADQIPFTNVSNVVAALGDFNNDQKTDFAFAISGVSANNLCVYYGTGIRAAQTSGSGNSYRSYEGGNYYPPQGVISGCMTLPTQTTNPSLANPPIFSYIAALPFTTNGLSQLLVEDSANNLLYVIQNNGTTGNNGALPGFTPLQTIQIPPTDGPGPIYTGYFDKNGNPFFVINGQTGLSATVYLGNSSGVFTPTTTYNFGGKIHSLLMQDMDVPADDIADMVVELDNGVIEIHKGIGDGTFVQASEGGTQAGLNGLTGNGGHLAAIGKLGNDSYNDILTTTPIGLSVLQGQGFIAGSLTYTLKGIYNIGPGRSSYALASFGNGALDLAVDSAEGVAFIQGNPDGSFQTSNAYSALAPALGATMGQFRTTNNPTNNVDVVVSTAANAVQGQLLTGNGDGTFNTLPGTTNPLAGLMTNQPPADLWSNILSGNFNGDGKRDLAYSLTGTPGTYSGPGLYVQYGVGDGSFLPPVAVTPSGSNNFYGESAVGLFDKSGNAGIANIDANYDDTLLWQSSNTFSVGLNKAVSGNTNFNQVAAGYIKTGTSYQDLVFQQGATTLVPYRNKQDGSGTFNAGTPLTVPSPVGNYAGNYAISTVLLTDIDGDGKGDILALYHNLAADPSNPSASTPNYLYIWWGNGDGTFNPTPFTLQLSRNYYLAAVADMNGDTLSDIVLSDGYIVSILYNQGSLNSQQNHSFGNETHFLAGQGINSLTLESVRGSTVPDLVVANGGATISNAVALEGTSASPISLTPNPADVNTGGITVLLNNITALYSGDTSNAQAVLSGPTGTHNIQGIATNTVLALCIGGSAPNCPVTGAPMGTLPVVPSLSMTYGEVYNGTESILDTNGTAFAGTGTLKFYQDGVLLCTLQASSTTPCNANVGTGTPAGTHVYYSVYSGDPNYIGSTSPTVTITVTRDTPAVTVTSSLNPAPSGQAVTLTATLLGANAPLGTALSPVGLYLPATGTVVFMNGSTTLCSSTLTADSSNIFSTATCTTSTLPVGTDQITVSYAGDTNFLPAIPGSFPETITKVNAADFTVSATPNPASVGVGYAALLTVMVTANNGFAEGVNLTCGSLPNEATCTFAPAAIPSGGGTSMLIVLTTAPHSCGTTEPYFLGGNGGGPHLAPFALPALAGLVAFLIPGKRRWLRALMALIVVAGITQMTGCGNCTDLGTRPATYTFQVIGTSTGTGVVQSQTVTLNITI
jgi:hypothetical protein